MPVVSALTLDLTTVNQQVNIKVTYKVTFSPFERQLAGLGMIFRQRIAVIGVDPAGSTTGTVLNLGDAFPNKRLPVTAGDTEQELTRIEEATVARSLLQEDAGADNDEIRCRIRIAAQGFPPPETSGDFTNQRTLLG